MQKEGQNNLYTTVSNYIPSKVIANKNRVKSWDYGYNEKYDVVVISKTGKIGEILNISGLYVALPDIPENIYSRHKDKKRTVLGKKRYTTSLI